MKAHLLFFSLLLPIGCTAPSPALPPAELEAPKIWSAILLLHGPQSERQVTVVETLLGEGRLKSAPFASPGRHIQTGDLHCTFLDHRKRPLHTIEVADPQRQELEYADPDGAFHRVSRTDTAAVFALRVAWRSDMQFLKIEEWREGKKKRRLTILRLYPDRL